MDDWLQPETGGKGSRSINTIDLLEEHGGQLGMPRRWATAFGNFVPATAGRYRVYFHWFRRTFGLLRGFTKKTQRTPRGEIDAGEGKRHALAREERQLNYCIEREDSASERSLS